MWYQIVKWIGSKFGYDICVGNDVIHMFDTDKVPHNCILIFEIEKVGFEEMKKKMRQTVIHHIKRYRQVPVNYLGFYFWKEVDKDLAKEQIKRWEKEIHTKEEALEYTQKQLAIKMPCDKPQWEFIYVEDFNEKESLCFFKFHHSFSDGGGIINSMLFMNNDKNVSQEMFKGRGIPFYLKLLNGLLYPICLFIWSFELWKYDWKGHDTTNFIQVDLIKNNYSIRRCRVPLNDQHFPKYFFGELHNGDFLFSKIFQLFY